MKRRIYLALGTMLTAQAAMSNAAGAQALIPGQSSQLPPAPTSQKGIPDIRIERQGRTSDQGPTGPSVLITSLHITGETRFSEPELIAAAGFVPGQVLNLADLRLMAARITDYYNSRGYVVAQAYLPAQEIKDGSVTIAVVEGRYGAITLHNQSRLRSDAAQDLLGDLDRCILIEADPLDRALLLLSDVPGVQVQSTLSPGSEVGTSDLLVELAPGPRVTGELEVDNGGDPYTGVLQGGGTVNFNEPFGIGDVASLRLLTSGSGMQYARGSYQAQWGEVTLGAAYAYFRYELGKQFSILHANGTEHVVSLYASYPLIRSYDNNLHATIDADHRIFQDRIDAVSSVTNRQSNTVTVGLLGDHHDEFGEDGWDAYSVYLTNGNLDIGSPLARAADEATVRTQGGYVKLKWSVDRLQTISGPFAIYGSIRGQLASKNLDISEKMELGGAYAVRAYPEGEAYGDEGYIATLEARLWLPQMSHDLPGRMQLVAFFDTGHVRFNKTPWFAGTNNATRSGAGVGLNWTDSNNFAVNVFYAQRVGTPAATSFRDSSGQFWFELVKFY